MNLFLITTLLGFGILLSQEKDKKERARSTKQSKNIVKKSRSRTVNKTKPKSVKLTKKRLPSKKIKKKNKASQVKATRQRKGRLSKISQSIQNKLIQKRTKVKDNRTIILGNEYYGYERGRAYYGNRYYDRYDRYTNFIGDLSDVIYVIDGRYPYLDKTFNDASDDFLYQYYTSYPYADDLFFKKSKNEAFPMMGKFDIINGSGNENDIELQSYQLKMAYQFLTLDIKYESLTETIDGLSDKFNFLLISPGLSYGIIDWKTLLSFHLGAGLMEVKSDYDTFQRSFGGLNTGLEFKTFLPFNISIGGAISYLGLKDKSDDVEDLFSIIMTDINMTLHIYRFGLKAGMKSQRFSGFSEPFSLSQPYFGLSVYF